MSGLLFLHTFLLQTIPGPEIDPNTAGAGLIEALGQSQWTLVAGFSIMIAVWILRIFVFPNLGKAAIPWVAVIIATLGTFAVTLVENPANWFQAITAGILAGVAAAGTWNLLPSGVKRAAQGAVKSRAK